jgi:hypothetical protein
MNTIPNSVRYIKNGEGGSVDYVTVKLVALVAFPPGVVTLILPVFAPLGTFTVTCVSEFTVNVVALTPPNVTAVA